MCVVIHVRTPKSFGFCELYHHFTYSCTGLNNVSSERYFKTLRVLATFLFILNLASLHNETLDGDKVYARRFNVKAWRRQESTARRQCPYLRTIHVTDTRRKPTHGYL